MADTVRNYARGNVERRKLGAGVAKICGKFHALFDAARGNWRGAERRCDDFDGRHFSVGFRGRKLASGHTGTMDVGAARTAAALGFTPSTSNGWGGTRATDTPKLRGRLWRLVFPLGEIS